MDSTPNSDGRQVETISLVASLEQGKWLKLPLAAMRDVGPAVQTLAGLLKLTNKETFVEASTIAGQARLPLATVRKHLVALDQRGWIKNKGRGETRHGRPRRTCTLALTAKTRDNISPFGVLPWWACGFIVKRKYKLSWGAKAVFSVAMARLMSLVAAIENQEGDTSDDSEVWGSIDNMGGIVERFRMKLDWLVEQTGLTRETIVHAKRELHEAGLILLTGGEDDIGRSVTDSVCPDPAAEIVVTPAKEQGKIYLEVRSSLDG